MTPYQNRKSRFTQRMAEQMLIMGKAQTTIDSYTYHVDRFANFLGKHPEHATPEDVRNFQLWMKESLKSSWSQFNQAVCGLRFYFTQVVKRDWVVTMIPFGHRPKKLPNVLSGDEVARLIECVPQLKHQTVLITLYAAGLRLNEALRLRIPHVNSSRMQLKIEQGKGGKDRYVPISPRLLEALRHYWKECRPSDYLFPGKTADVPLNGAVIQKACTLGAAKARINSHVTPHTLRHSYATGLLEAGVDLMAISKLLGHASFMTTMVYLHCRKQHLDSSPSPLDWLPVRQCPKWIDPTLEAPPNPPAIPPDSESSKD